MPPPGSSPRACFDLNAEAFDHLELTDQRGGERFDRAPVVEGEIRIGDRAYMQPDRLARVLAEGGDVVVRAGWKGASWRDRDGGPLDVIALLEAAQGRDRLDLPIRIARKGKGAEPLTGLRLIAIRKSPEQAEASRKKARKAARTGQHKIRRETLVAAEWVLLVTSLDASAFDTEAVGNLYRLPLPAFASKRLRAADGASNSPSSD